MNKTIITTSWDDGHPLDLKLAELLSKYNVPATFYIPTNCPGIQRLTSRDIKEIAQDFDIGGHSCNHPNLTQIPIEDAKNEIVDCKKTLEEIISREITSFCYPYGRFNNEIARLVKEAGFNGARTVKRFTRSIKDPFKMGTMLHTKDYGTYIRHIVTSNDFRLLCFMLKNNLVNKHWDEVAIGTLEFTVANGGIWHLWGHSWEIEATNNWTRLEKVLQKISKLPEEVQKVTNRQLVQSITLPHI